MDEQSKVVSMKRFKAKRRFKSLKRALISPTVLIIGGLLLICGIGSSSYFTDTKENPTHGLKGAKSELMDFKPDSWSSVNHLR